MNRIKVAIETALFLFQLFAKLPEAIKAAEEALPGEGRGEAKLKMVRMWIESALALVSDLAVTFDDIWPRAQDVISNIVDIFNTEGEFEKKSP